MGKVLLILVLGTTLSGTFYLAQLQQGANESATRHATRSYASLAEDVAQSGYAVGVQRLHESFEPFTEADVSYGSGTFDLTATSTASGTMSLVASGRSGPAEYAIAGEYARLSRPCDLLGALFLNGQLGPVVSLVGTGFSIRGEDTRPASRVGGRAIVDGPGYTVAGILADTLVSQSFEVPLAGLGTLSAGITVGGVSDEGYLRDLIGCVLGLAAEVVAEAPVTFSGSHTWVNRTFGSPTAPTILSVRDDATFRGTTRGYGILLTGGNITAEDDFIWEGLVLSVGDGPAMLTLSDSSRVYGGVASAGGPLPLLALIQGVSLPFLSLDMFLDPEDGVLGWLGLYRRPVGFSITDGAGIYASEEALGRLADLLPSLERESRVVVLNERFGMAAGS